MAHDGTVHPENIEDVELEGITPEAAAALSPSELVCPTIPGLTFPKLPSLDEFGTLIGEKLASEAEAAGIPLEALQLQAEALEKRIRNPPSATDLMNELSTQVSSAADKAVIALENAAIDIANQVAANLVAEWDKAVKLASGLTDIYNGLKNAAECLKGEPGSADEAFTATPEKQGKGLAEGNGLSASEADEAITNSSEESTDETGNKVENKKTISSEEALAAVEGTTKTPVPQSAEPLVSHQYVSRVA